MNILSYNCRINPEIKYNRITKKDLVICNAFKHNVQRRNHKGCLGMYGTEAGKYRYLKIWDSLKTLCGRKCIGITTYIIKKKKEWKSMIQTLLSKLKYEIILKKITDK